jgi:hypothetical protein
MDMAKIPSQNTQGEGMEHTCAIVICGTEHGINEFLTQLGHSHPFTVIGEPTRVLGRYEAKFSFTHSPDQIEIFFGREYPYITASICSCDANHNSLW